MMAYAFYDDEDVLVAGEPGGADRTQEDGGTMLVTSAGQATVMSEPKTRTVRELLASSGNELELPVRIIVT